MVKTDIQTYVNNFRRRIAAYLRPGIGMTTTVHPASDGGAILVFELGPGFANDDHFKETKPSVNAALSEIEQHAFSGPLNGIRFTGTNTILEPGRLIFIKDKNRSEWSDAAAAKDVAKVVPNSSERQA